MKMATAPWQPRTGAFTTPASLSESARARIAAELAAELSTERKKEETPQSNGEAVKSDSDRP
jgi:hypothetical protein